MVERRGVGRSQSDATSSKTIVDVLERRAREQPMTRAYCFLSEGGEPGAELTYAELYFRARHVAMRLREQGARGKPVLLAYDTCPELLVAFFGCLVAGALAIPTKRLRPGLPGRVRDAARAQAIVRDAGTELVLASREDREHLERVLVARHRRPRTLRVLTELRPSTTPLDRPHPRREDPAPLAFLQYTSGSTADPKGVMVSHANLMHNLACANLVQQNDADSVSVCWLPLHHDMGLIEGVLQPLYSGYPAYLFEPSWFIAEPLRWLRAISRYRATNSGGPNFAYDHCVRKIPDFGRDDLDLACWRVAYNGAEPISHETLGRFAKAFEPCGFHPQSLYPVYGLAESTLVVSSGRRAEPPRCLTLDRKALDNGQVVPSSNGHGGARVTRVGCGKPVPETRVRIVNPETRRECSPNEIGEIWIQGPSVCRGYWNRPAATRRTFGARMIDGPACERSMDEGKDASTFLRSGDLGFLWQGELYIAGRLEDCLNLRGVKHHPSDIEWCAERAHPAIRAGCTAAVARTGAEGASTVLLAETRLDPGKESDRLTFGEVLSRIHRDVLAGQGLRLDEIVLLAPGALHKTTSGKLRRRACLKALDDDRLPVLARGSFSKDPPGAEMEGAGDWRSSLTRRAQSMATRLSGRPVGLRTPLARCLDSLAWLELVSAVGRWSGSRPRLETLIQQPNLHGLIESATKAREPVSVRSDDAVLMRDDALLPEDILPSRGRAFQPAGPAVQPQSILLTGATGFLGAHLLAALLELRGVSVRCLVRAGGALRVRENLEKLGLWKPPFAGGFEVVSGDLTREQLGLSAGEWGRLADDTDAVYHAAAEVNFVYSYRRLRQANVIGTRELLRLACTRAEKKVSFHFVSSIAACHATGLAEIDERMDLLPHVARLPLGYGRTKCVAEALVRQAAERGLHARVYRASLVAGDSRSGRSNADDFLSRWIRGCVRIGAAPDLDVTLDACPVDHVARAIVVLSRQVSESAFDVHHLTQSEPRHFRELVLWMNLYGYRVELVPFRDWLGRLLEAASDPMHPLAPLQEFFTRRVGARVEDLLLPELYERARLPRLRSAKTKRMLKRLAIQPASLTSSYLERTVSDLRRRGYLPRVAPRRPDSRGDELPVPRAWLLQLARRRCGQQEIDLVDVSCHPAGAGKSIVTELCSWNASRPRGLYHCRMSVRLPGGHISEQRCFLKIKPSGDEVLSVATTVARLCGEKVGKAYARFGGQLGFSRGHLRELAIYQQNIPQLRGSLPKLFGVLRRDADGIWALALEDLSDEGGLDRTQQSWRREDIEAVIRGMAGLHSIWLGRERELVNAPWLGEVLTSKTVGAMQELWRCLAEHALPWFRTWAGEDIAAHQRQAVADLAGSWTEMESMPRTLIHNDFNPRNVFLRASTVGSGRRLCAYDWELATLGLPQHDLAEFLCFTVPRNFTASDLEHYLSLHRETLERLSGKSLNAARWRRGFALALTDLIMHRLALYVLVHRFQEQPYLARVLPNWMRLVAMAGSLETTRESFPSPVDPSSAVSVGTRR